MIAMLRAIRDPTDRVALARPAAAAVQQLLEGMAVAASQLDVRDLFYELMEQSGYLRSAPDAADNVSRFSENIADFFGTSPDHLLDAFMHHLDLVLISGEDEEPASSDLADAIQVMTIHQSKGREFEAVFVPSLVEGRPPHAGASPRFELPPAVAEPPVRRRGAVSVE